ncbi:MAG: recombination protein RecO [Campylobacter sp.]|nr:recombination protein RecO [Campylobacter sp.]
MQGYILRVQKVKDEDCIVHILSAKNLTQTYRFYGARHSNIALGYKIDFELESSPKFLPRLRNVMHLGLEWLHSRQKMIIWQEFIRLLYKHLSGLEDIEESYMQILDNAYMKFNKENPKRVIVEAYIEILQNEGRLYDEFKCFICDSKIAGKVALARAFLPACESCINKSGFDKKELLELYRLKSTINLDDEVVDELFNIVLQGM